MALEGQACGHFKCFSDRVFELPFLLTTQSLSDGIFTKMLLEISKNAETRISTCHKSTQQSICQNHCQFKVFSNQKVWC